MTERVQPGATVEKKLWQEFRQHVKDRHGKTRGSLGDELETAIRNHIYHGTDAPVPEQLETFNQRLARIENQLGTAEADGGTDTSDGGEHTHAPSRVEAAATEKPAANAATEKKVRYLAECVRDEQGGSNGVVEEVPRSHLIETVKSEYGFRSDTAKRYVDELVAWFDLRPHPGQGRNPKAQLYVSEAKHDELAAAESEQAAATEEARLAAAEPEQ